ncbi:MAG: DNA polymerase III subunit delta' [Candidatus Cloacimonetes bacterium]|nr:DNA polymerase III subunit delta' [Candidatus Cloacimonadota bacterium]
MFEKIKGQDKTIEILRRSLKQNKVANSYLFSGPEGVGKFTSALYFGMAVNCHATLDRRPCGVCPSCSKFLSFSHPDLIYIFPFPKESGKSDITVQGEIRSDKTLMEYEEYISNKMKSPWKEFFFSKNIGIRIASIRMLEHRIQLSPNEGNYKIAIIEHADLMNVQAANAFLKTLEEPPEDTIIILTTSKPNSLLPTILSRCQNLNFYPVPKTIIEQELQNFDTLEIFEAKMIARMVNGNIEKALRLMEGGRVEVRQQTLQFLQFVLEKDDRKFLELSNQFRTSKNLSKLEEMISQLIMWLSDLAYFKHEQSEITNLDKTEMLETLFNSNPEVEDYAPDLINFMEKMLQRLTGHVNPQLVIIEIFNRFKDTFNNQNQSAAQ